MKARHSDLAAGQLPLVGIVEYVPIGDNCLRMVAQKPVALVSITKAAKLTGISRNTIYRLYKAGFIGGDQVSPKKIRVDLAGLNAWRKDSEQEGFWTAERKQRFLAGAGKSSG